MADYTYRKRTTVAHEWLIPAGAAISEIGKAISSAQNKYTEIHGGPPSYDDWARVDVTDDAVVIRIEEETRG